MKPTAEHLAQGLGRQLRGRRVHQGLTQQHVADRANISRRTLSSLENGDGSSVDSLLRVLTVLDATDWIADLVPANTFNPFDVVAEEQRATTLPRVRPQ